MNDYRIQLGIDFNDKELNNIKKQLTNLTDNTHRIRIDIDNSRLLKQIEHAKKELKELNGTKGNQPSLTVNTQSLEKSLSRVADVVDQVRKSLGTLDDKSGMQSLVASVNQIATALGKVEGESDSLLKSLSALSKKDFSINFDFKMGKSASQISSEQGDIKRDAIGQLKQQAKALEDYLDQYYKVTQKKEGVVKLTQGTNLFSSFWEMSPNIGNTKVSLKQQVSTYKQYIDLMQEAAKIKGVDLSSITSSFSKTTNDIVEETKKVSDGAEEAKQALKGIFGGSLDVEGLSGQLQPIIADLGEIKTAIQSLSSKNSIDGLTKSFNRLSETLEKLTANLTLAKNTLDTGFSSASPINNAVKVAQQTGKKIGEAVGQSAAQSIGQSINLDDVIDEQVLKLMNEYAIAGDKGSKAFDEIKQSLNDFRNGSGDINKVTSAISNNMKIVNEAKNDYKELADYIRMFNASGAKVHIPDSIKQEYGDDYKSMRSQLGKGFTSGQGMDFETFVVELNSILGDTIDLSHGAEAAFGDLVRKVNSTKGGKFLTGDDLFKSGALDMGDVVANISTSLEQIENAEEEIARTSTTTTNTVVQNEERKQQAYQETKRLISDSAKEAIDSVSSQSIDKAFVVDESDSIKFRQEMENLVRQWTDAKGELTDIKINTGTFYDKDTERNIERITQAQVTYNNELGETIKKTIALRQIGTKQTGEKYDKETKKNVPVYEPVFGFMEVSGQYSKSLGKTKVQTDAFVKQQKQAVANLTNQINQLNRAASDKNASRPIKDVSHLDILSSKYDEITSAIQRMNNASDSNTFTDAKIEVEKLISEYKSLVKEFKNAENVSSKMKGTDFASGLDIAKNDLEKFKAQAKDFPQIAKTISGLDTAIKGVGDASSLNKFNDQLRVARSELAKIKSEISAANRSEKVGINVSGLESKITDLRRISPEIDKFEAEIDGAKVSVESLLSDLKKVNTQGDFSVVNSRFKAFADSAKAAGIAITETASKARTIKDIKFDIDTGAFDDDLSRIYEKFNKLSDSPKDLEDGIRQVEAALREMELAAGTGDEVADAERLIKAQQDYAMALEKTNNLLRIQAREEKANIEIEKLQDDRNLFQQKIDTWLTKNSAATKKFGANMRDLQNQAKNCDRVTLNHLEKEFRRLDSAAEQAGLKVQSLGDRIKNKFKEYAAYLSVAEVFMYVEQALRAMFDTVLEIDTAMTGLYRVTDLTAAQYDTLFDNMISSAKEYGATLNDIINATTDWVRAGFDADTALGLAEVTTMYQHISDLDYDTAAENLITAYNGFKEELNGAFDGDQVAAVNYIADIFNELDNNFAVTSAGLGEALTRSASALDLAGNSIQETAGMVTGIVEVTQDPEKAGSALKVLSLRLRGMKGQLEELGEETDENVENISKMQGQILNMTKGKVNIFDGAGNFKSTYEIMKGIADVWDELSSIDQANLLETIAGKNRANDVAALLSNWKNVEAAVKSASEAEGSAARENAKYVDSLQGRLDKLTTAWQSFANTFMNSDLLKGGVSALTELLEIVEKLVESLGAAGTIGLGAGIFGLFKNGKSIFGDLSTFGSLALDVIGSSDKLGAKFKNLGKAAGKAGGNIAKSLTGSLSGMVGVIGLVVAAVGLAVNAYKNHKEEQSRLRQEVIETSDTYLDAASNFEQAYIKYSGRTYLTAEEEADLESAIKGTADALGDKDSALQSAVNSSNDYLASLEAIKNAELEAAKAAAENKRDNAAEELREAAIGWESWDGSEVNVSLGSNEAIEIAKKVGGDFYKTQKSQMPFLAAGEVGMQEYESFKLELSGNADISEIVEYYNVLLDYKDALSEAGLEESAEFEKVGTAIEKISESISVYTEGVYEAAKANYQLSEGIPKTAEEYIAMREAILGDAQLDGFSLDKKMSILNSLDSEYGQLFDISSVEAQARKFVGIIKGFGDGTKDGTNEIGAVETFLNMRTAVNNNDCTVGEYLSELDNITSVSEKFSDEEQKQFNLAFGIDTDSIKKQYDALKTKLTDEYYGIEMSNNNAKMFLDNLKSQELSAASELFSSNNVDFKNILKDYNSVLEEAKQAGVDFSKTTYGNIDTNARKTLEWNSENLKKYKDEIMSWEPENAKWDNVKKGYEDTISTVMGAWDTFEIDGKKVDIAFSPMLQTDSGAELLSSGTVDAYINQLIAKATEDDKWDKAELIKLDAEGLEVDGQKIKGILADIGNTAEATSMQMHFVGKDGALAMAGDELFALVEKQVRLIEAMNYTIAIDVETESLDSLNSALSESVSGIGLSSESITALKGRYAELASQGYDLSAMFEETSNGIHLNKNAVSEFEQALASQKLSETDGKLDVLKKRYDELTNEINNCTDAGERASLYSDQQEVAQKINDLATLASQYKGLTSAYNAWQNAESAGNERDMYESIIEGFENIGDEISRGWYDDGTIKFLELMTGQTDLAGKSASELKKIWNSLDDTIKGTSYSVKDFFTTNKDGESTSTGAYNFLKAVEQLGKKGKFKFENGKTLNDLITRKDGKKDGAIVGFDFNVVGGDKAIAEVLGVSEEMVQIIQRTLDDAGFVVTLDGKYTLLADLKTSAEEANNALKKLKTDGLESLKDADLNFDFDVNTVEGYQEQLEKATAVLDKFRDKNGKLKTDANGKLVKGAQEALDIAEYYTAAMDKLTEPKIMQIDTSTVDEELQDPIEKMQTIGDLCKEKHLVSLTGDTEEINKVQGEIDKVAKELEELDPEIKAQIGIDEDWDAKTIADKIENGEIEVPAELKLDVQMSEDLKDMRLLMMRQLGLVSEEEVKLKVGYEIDESTVDNLTPDEQKVVVEFISKNEDWFNKLTDDEKKVAIELVASGVDLDSLTNDEEKEIVVEFVAKNEDIWNKLSDEEKQAVVKYVAKHDEVDSWEPEDKEALVRLIVDKDNVDNWKPEDVDAVVKYYADDEQVKEWTPEEKKAFAKYLVDGGEVDGWSPEAKDAFVKYLVDGGDPDKFDPDDKESWVVYKNDTTAQDSYEPDDESATVKYDKDSVIPDTYDPANPPALVIYDINTNAVDVYNPPDIFRTVYYTIKETFEKVASGGKSKADQRTGANPDGKGGVNGTANVNGTIGRAFKQGSWGTKNSGTALVGELGRETLVRDGRYYTIGDTGAEFIKYQKGDIIFNHKQTEELFNNGRVTSGGGRAKALVGGTAFAQGTAFGSGTGGGEEPEVKTIVVGTNKNTGKSYTKSSDSKDDFEETLDWIEIAIDRIERAIDQLDQKASNVYKSWSSRNTALSNEISKVGDEIDLQQRAYNEYIDAANGVGLSSSYAEKVRNGTIDIETIKDEVLKEKIDDYQEFYEAALKCQDAIEELKETESELYKQRFDNVSAQYDGILGVIEHEKNMLDNYISQSEANAWFVSEEYYKALETNEREKIAQLESQKANMIAELNAAVNSGTIAKESEAWYEMVNAVDEVTLAIQESQTTIEEYEQTIQQLNWEVFDIMQERISGVTEEADFLIELMSNSDLFDDNGKLTNKGKSTMGLHGQNYNAYMYQADKYYDEVYGDGGLNDQIESDPYDQDLINRRDELLELQREAILAAENERDAIKSLVEEGIELELDSLSELIDKYNDALDSEKDLYDYQKKVKKQTEEIADIEKMLAAYSGDNSEEARAKVQELKISLSDAKSDLEDSERDWDISSQQQLLDDFYLEYETVLNTRLDNIDALISGVIEEINADAGIISSTIEEVSKSVGYELSDSMSSIWDENSTGTENVIATYADKLAFGQTTTNLALDKICDDLDKVLNSLNYKASTNVKKASTSSVSKPSSTTKKTTSTKTTTKKSSGGDGKPKIGDRVKFVSGQYYYDSQGKKPLGSHKQGEYVYITNINNRDWATHPYHISTSNKLGSGDLGWLKLNQISGYETGKKNFSKDEVAWTQENGREFIVRPSDGAILTPIAKKGSVLNAQASNNLWNMTNSPAEFIRDNLNLGTANVPNNSNSQNTYTQHLDKVVFNLPNVKNYDELLAAMQRDKNFERLIFSMTVDRLAGKSALAKGKSIH